MRVKKYRSTEVEPTTLGAIPLAPVIPTRPLILPWSCLVSDNARFAVVYGQNRLSTTYRKAKKEIAARASCYWPGTLLAGNLTLVARFYFPDARKRDAGNYRKALTDALSGVIYADDKQLTDERYILVAIDRDAPRCEVTLGLTETGKGRTPGHLYSAIPGELST